MKRVLLSLVLFAPSLLNAHTGAGPADGFSHGFAHPWGGWDHLLAMLAVGLWASQLGGRALWSVPCAFVGVMALGGLLGMAQLALPGIELGILASVLVLGVLVAAAARLPLAVSASIVGIFALFHGLAHGLEMPAGSSGAGYALGFVLATLLVHALGLALGLGFQRLAQPGLVRLAGAACACWGLVLALG